MKNKLLICSEYYKPGSRAGGIIEAAFNLAKGMSLFFEVYIITTDKDLLELKPYKNITLNKWIETDVNIKVMYVQSNISSLFRIFNTIRFLQPDSIFINGLFSKKYSVLPILMKYFKFVKAKVVLSPRGMLKETAIQFKKSKKALFISSFNFLSVAKCLEFHATDQNEVEEIKKSFGKNVKVNQIYDLVIGDNEKFVHLTKKIGELNCLFVGRIHPIKNLVFFINLLKKLDKSFDIKFTIAGSIEDSKYWNNCNEIIKIVNVKDVASLICPKN